MSETIVRHSGGQYPVLVEPGIAKRLGRLLNQMAPGHRVVVITDRRVARQVATDLVAERLTVARGEGSKSVAVWSQLIDRLGRRQFGRDTVIVALGGGVIGDLAGFTAASYLRGVPYLQVPTTLLAMVDASVGGKTGLNTTNGKNLIGAFRPPIAVAIDPQVTSTEASATFRGGLVEALKHGLIGDRSYFRWILRSADRLLARDPAAIERLVRRSVAIKAQVVGTDERELGRRAVLNAGHTVGHALEQASGYRVRHGDAVALGLVAEAVLAGQLGLTDPALAVELVGATRALGIPLGFPATVTDLGLVAAIRLDKKNRAGRIRCSLVPAVGVLANQPGPWTVECSPTMLKRALQTTRRLVG